MEVPWGWIQANKELKDLQRKVDVALKLLKLDNPDVQGAIKILED